MKLTDFLVAVVKGKGTTMRGKNGAVLCVCFLSLACLLSSCNRERMQTLTSPFQAVATLLEMADGTVVAELVLISTAKPKHEFVTDAQDVRLRIPGGEMVTLEQAEPGHYKANSTQNPELVYKAGETYQFRFDLPAPVTQQGRGARQQTEAPQDEQKTYVAVTKTPTRQAKFLWDKKPEFAGDTARLTWKPRTFLAIVVVRSPEGEVCYSTFDFTDPQFGGDKWGRLGLNGALTLGVDVFSKPGTYQILKCGVTRNAGFDPEMSAGLGILSGFLAGACEEVETLEVPE